jgi:aconitase A
MEPEELHQYKYVTARVSYLGAGSRSLLLEKRGTIQGMAETPAFDSVWFFVAKIHPGLQEAWEYQH